MDLTAFPRVKLMHGDTPLHDLPGLGRALGTQRLLIKRDDCTGLAFGGNKTRKLEFALGEALRRDADVIITTGAWQSNHVRQTAAAAARLGLRCHAVVHSPLPAPGGDYRRSGNLLLDRLLGCTLHDVASEEAGIECIAALAGREAATGAIPHVVTMGASDGVGALGYVACAQELLRQCRDIAAAPSHIVLATGSAGTHAGLLAGLRVAGSDIAVVGISVSEPAESKRIRVRRVLDDLARTTGTPVQVPDEAIVVLDDYAGQGYGVPTAAGDVALRLLARKEGILLDPVYTAKAMSGFLDLLAHARCGPMRDPVFLHTGGTPALFAYLDHYLPGTAM
ncbi:D-cysteine desulfhydrase family protein [Luteimonas sp. XNQY3]|nr:D-cysteine desulfhydrase family protein [Luteimonas sp. XNQY3]MCD9005715.1 D-cysteine desulfhydrase family protein [Luteimonas sp. XNQY3]